MSATTGVERVALGTPAHRVAWPPIRAAAVLPLLAAGTALAARLWSGAHPVDDAFITFRYARNLATGAGLAYNPGEWVLGTTSPVWAVLLALGYRVGLTDLPGLALSVSALFDASTAALLAWLGIRLARQPAGAGVGFAWALNAPSTAYAAGGMETSLFVLAVLGALVLAARGRWTTAAVVAGLSAGVRPEGALAAAAVVTAHLAMVRGWRRSLPVGIAAAVPIALGAIWIAATYGTLVPQTVIAKQGAYLPQPPWTSAAILALQAGLPGWSTFFPSLVPLAIALPLALGGLAAFAVLTVRGLRRRGKTDRRWLPFAVFLLLYLAFHTLAGARGGRLFPWYLVPAIPLYLLAAAAGLATCRPRVAALGLAGLVLWQMPAVDWSRPFLPAGFDLRRETLYAQVGSDLAATYPPATRLAAPEIGTLGYRSGLRVLDTVGLVSPVASRFYPLPPNEVVGDNGVPAGLIRQEQPELVVALDQFVRLSLQPDPWFQQAYRLVRTVPAPIWESRELLVYERIVPLVERLNP
ncbi:MAG: hypothetical protein HYX52_03245 [Chloroflexi bacterium]|nr:hypothetical protein [Chloroflexota bacterium]